jgi:protein-disulfide isomerase
MVAMMLSLSSPARAQSSSDLQAIKQELAGLREAQQSMAKEVEALRTLLQQAMGPRPAAAGATAGTGAAMPSGAVQPLTVAGRPSKGNPRAKLTLVEYSDYECPFCGQYVAQVYPQIDQAYIATNKINYVFKNFPIEQLHRQSFKAHMAAACAGDQRRYWEMHDRLFLDQRSLSLDRFVEIATMLKLDPVAFRACVESTKHEAMIAKTSPRRSAAAYKGRRCSCSPTPIRRARASRRCGSSSGHSRSRPSKRPSTPCSRTPTLTLVRKEATVIRKLLLCCAFVFAVQAFTATEAAAQSCGGEGQVPCLQWSWCAYTTPSIFGDVCWGGLVYMTSWAGCSSDRFNNWGLFCSACGGAGQPTCNYGSTCNTDQRYTPFGLCYPCGRNGQAPAYQEHRATRAIEPYSGSARTRGSRPSRRPTWSRCRR